MSQYLQAYTFTLPNFSGPLDLLLHLIRKNRVAIEDIPVAEITRQYLAMLEAMRALKLEIASEFLVMAATLLQIKSRMLLPRQGRDEADASGAEVAEEAEQGDPQQALAQRLAAYAPYREAAEWLQQQAQLHWDEFAPPGEEPDLEELPLENPGVFALVEALESLLEVRFGEDIQHAVAREPYPLRRALTDVVRALEEQGVRQFEALVPPQAGKGRVISLFMALLELVRWRCLSVWQPVPQGALKLEMRDDWSRQLPRLWQELDRQPYA